MKHQTHFDQAWQLLLDGHDLHSILARFPDEKDELEPLLQAALRLRAVQNLTASTSFRQTTRIRILNSIQASSAPTPRPHRRSYFNFQLPWLLGRSSWVGALLALVVLLSGMTATTVAAQAALPGDILYPVKRTSEEIQRLLASDPLTQNLILSERRLAEAQALQAQARYKNIPQALSLYRQELAQMAKLMSAATMPGDSIPQLQQQIQQLHNLDQVLPDAQQALIAESLEQATDILYQAQSSDSSHPEPEQSQEPVITLTPTSMPDMGGPQPSATPGMGGPHPSATPGMGGPHPSATPGMSGPHPSATPGMGGPHPSATPDMSGPQPSATPGMGGPHPSATPDMSGPHPSATPGMGGPQPSATPGMGGPHPSATPDMSGPHPSATPGMGGPHPSATPGMGGPHHTPTPQPSATPITDTTSTPTPGMGGPQPSATPGMGGPHHTPTPQPSATPITDTTSTPTPGMGGPQPSATPGMGGPHHTPTPQPSATPITDTTSTPTPGMGGPRHTPSPGMGKPRAR